MIHNLLHVSSSMVEILQPWPISCYKPLNLEVGKRYIQSALSSRGMPWSHTLFPVPPAALKAIHLLVENLKESLAPTILASGLESSLSFVGWVSCLPRLPGLQPLSALIPSPWLFIWPPDSLESYRTQMAMHFLILPGFLAVQYLTCFWALRSLATLPPAGSSVPRLWSALATPFRFLQHTSLDCQEVNSHPINCKFPPQFFFPCFGLCLISTICLLNLSIIFTFIDSHTKNF